MDIKASARGICGIKVTIEIKRDSHIDLWRAMKDQLIANYVRKPGSSYMRTTYCADLGAPF